MGENARTSRRKAALWRRRIRTACFVAGEAGKVAFLLACAIVIGGLSWFSFWHHQSGHDGREPVQSAAWGQIDERNV